MFTAEAVDALPGPSWLRQRRAAAFADGTPLPSEKEEVWRYSPVDRLSLDDYDPDRAPSGTDPLLDAFLADLRADVPERSALVVTRAGRLVSVETSGLPAGVTLGGLDDVGDGPRPGQVLDGGDALVRLNDAFMPDAVVLDLPPGARLAAPVVVVHWCAGGDGEPAPATFPRTVVRLGDGAEGSVVEVVAGAPGTSSALVVPVTELDVAPGGHLAHVGLQVLGTGAWVIGRCAVTVGAGGSVRTFAVGLGGAYDRNRTDAAVTGPGAATQLHSAYLGTGDQVHDIRTLQDHLAPRTTSELLCKGAVAARSRSVYSGLIRVRRGAVKAEAMQTNHNLVLDEAAHADSVPNLDIAENDVRCSHASTIGPVDEDQRYYLESRGVAPTEAERLIVLGFFDDMVDRCPVPSFTGRIRREFNLRLAEALALGASGGAA